MDNIINSLYTLSSFRSILDNLGISETKVNSFLSLYKTFSRDSIDTVSHQEKITAIRLFLKKERKQIQNIFSDSFLSNYDCLTKCIFAGLICEHYGIKLNIARPKEIFRYYHAFLVDSNKCIYKMAGRRKINNYIILNDQDIINRLKLIHPVIKIGGIIKRKIRSITKH